MTDTTERIAPPPHYPDRIWHNDGFYAVEPEIRTAYVAQANAGIGSPAAYRHAPAVSISVPTDDGTTEYREPTYEEWAHLVRRDTARSSIRSSEITAEIDRTEYVDCVLCGTHEHYLLMRQHREGPLGRVLAWTCGPCAPTLETELRGAVAMPSGASRADVARQVAARLLAGDELGPLELRGIAR